MNKVHKRNPGIALYIVLITSFLLVAAANPSWSADKYVSDSFEITLRSGPASDNSIETMLSSGTPLTALDEKSSWIKVRTPQGEEGWVMKRYVMDQTPKSIIIENLENKIDKLQSQKNESQKLVSNLRNKNKKLHKDLNQIQTKFQETKNNYEDLKSTAGQAMELKKNYKSAQKKLKKNKEKIDSLKKENSKLRSKIRLYWFIAGGTLVFVSAIIGFILGRLQRKKSKKVYF